MKLIIAILVAIAVGVGVCVIVNEECEHGDNLGYRAGEPDLYPPTQGDEWNTETEDIDE